MILHCVCLLEFGAQLEDPCFYSHYCKKQLFWKGQWPHLQLWWLLILFWSEDLSSQGLPSVDAAGRWKGILRAVQEVGGASSGSRLSEVGWDRFPIQKFICPLAVTDLSSKAMGLYCVWWLAKAGLLPRGMHRITWKAWQCPDFWAPSSESQIQRVCGGAWELTFLRSSQLMPSLWSGAHSFE